MGVSGVPLEPLFTFFFEDDVTRLWGKAFRCVYSGPIVLQARGRAGGRAGAPLCIPLLRAHSFVLCSLSSAAAWRSARCLRASSTSCGFSGVVRVSTGVGG